jgi:outer membrane protein assembly factor BamB
VANTKIVIALLIVGLLVVSIIVYQQYMPNPASPSSNDELPAPQRNILFKEEIREFVNSIVVEDGKFFTLDDDGVLNCFDAQSGSLLWQTATGSWRSGGIVIKNGVIYVGTISGVIKTVNETTGKLLDLQFQAPVSTSWGSKSPPTAFSVVDDQVFATQTGCAAFNAQTCSQLWISLPATMLNPPNMPYTGNVWAFDGNLVLGASSYPHDNTYSNGYIRIAPDTGTALWGIECVNPQEPLIYHSRIILTNFGNYIQKFCTNVSVVTASSGAMLWSYDLGSSTYKPIVYEDMLLLAATNGYFYALNLSNNSLSWKTPLNTAGTLHDAAVSPIRVDEQTQKIYWAYANTRTNGSDDNVIYDGVLCSLDLATGGNLQTQTFQSNCTEPFFTQRNPLLGLVLLNHTAYLTVQKDLWAFNKSSLQPVGVQQFDYRLVTPVVAYGKLYVAADFYALAYSDIDDS